MGNFVYDNSKSGLDPRDYAKKDAFYLTGWKLATEIGRALLLQKRSAWIQSRTKAGSVPKPGEIAAFALDPGERLKINVTMIRSHGLAQIAEGMNNADLVKFFPYCVRVGQEHDTKGTYGQMYKEVMSQVVDVFEMLNERGLVSQLGDGTRAAYVGLATKYTASIEKTREAEQLKIEVQTREKEQDVAERVRQSDKGQDLDALKSGVVESQAQDLTERTKAKDLADMVRQQQDLTGGKP